MSPQAPCQRDVCTDRPAHLGGAHLDPASELFDGPDVALAALPIACRDSAQRLMWAARDHSWSRVTVETALYEMAEEILRLREQVAAVRVDADRKVREAMARAGDCVEHAEHLRYEAHMVHALDRRCIQLEEERRMWLDMAFVLRQAFEKRSELWAAEFVKMIADADRAAARVRRRSEPPSIADCQRAGRCEHPAPTPHAACEQLRLDFAEGEVA